MDIIRKNIDLPKSVADTLAEYARNNNTTTKAMIEQLAIKQAKKISKQSK